MGKADQDRDRRLAEALRANLRKRKERDRAPDSDIPLDNPARDPT